MRASVRALCGALLACGTSVFAPISVAQTSVTPSPAAQTATAQTSLTPTSAPSQQAPDRIAILDTPPWYFQQDNAPQGLLLDLTALLFAESAPTLQPLPPRRLAAELASGAFHWAYWPCHVAAGTFSNLGVVATTQYGACRQPISATSRPAPAHGRGLDRTARHVAGAGNRSGDNQA